MLVVGSGGVLSPEAGRERHGDVPGEEKHPAVEIQTPAGKSARSGRVLGQRRGGGRLRDGDHGLRAEAGRSVHRVLGPGHGPHAVPDSHVVQLSVKAAHKRHPVSTLSRYRAKQTAPRIGKASGKHRSPPPSSSSSSLVWVGSAPLPPLVDPGTAGRTRRGSWAAARRSGDSGDTPETLRTVPVTQQHVRGSPYKGVLGRGLFGASQDADVTNGRLGGVARDELDAKSPLPEGLLLWGGGGEGDTAQPQLGAEPHLPGAFAEGRTCVHRLLDGDEAHGQSVLDVDQLHVHQNVAQVALREKEREEKASCSGAARKTKRCQTASTAPRPRRRTYVFLREDPGEAQVPRHLGFEKPVFPEVGVQAVCRRRHLEET